MTEVTRSKKQERRKERRKKVKLTQTFIIMIRPGGQSVLRRTSLTWWPLLPPMQGKRRAFKNITAIKSGWNTNRFLQTATSYAVCHPEISDRCHRDASTMPPGHLATVGKLKTFILPDHVMGIPSDRELGREMIDTWRTDGIFQISVTADQSPLLNRAFDDSKAFFQLPLDFKAGHVDSQSFSGYIASGEEITGDVADYSEIFTVTKDLAESDARVRSGWPCHGPCPWPSRRYERTMKDLMYQFGVSGEKILQLVALGLGLDDEDFFSNLTQDGWHHMRILR